MKHTLFLILAFFVLANFNSFSQNLNQHLVAYWSFDDSNCKDYSGNNYNGTPINNPTYIDDGISGKAIHFEGKGWYIVEGTDVSNIGSHVLLPKIEFSKYDEFTISLWVKFNDFSHWPSGDSYIFFGHHNNGWLGVFNHIFEYKMDGKLINSFAVGGKLWDNVIQTDFQDSFKNSWVYYTLTFSKNLVKGYINGKLVGQLNRSVSIAGKTAALARHWWLYDGEERTSARFTGDMDEVKIFSKALTEEEIKNEMNPCKEQPLAKIQSTGNNLCEGEIVKLSLDNTFSNIYWSTGENTQSISVTKSGNYVCTYFNNENCIGRDTLAVNFFAKPLSQIEPLEKYDFCDGESVNLKLKDIFNSYLWSNGDTTQSTKVSTSGIYKIKYTNSNGCSSEDSVKINFYPVPSAKIMKFPNVVLCDGEPVQLYLEKKYTNILWSDGQTKDTITVNKSGKYYVTFWNNPTCITSDTIEVKYNERPSASISRNPNIAVCEGDSLILTIGGNYSNILWSTGENQNSITVRKTGTYKVSFWNDPNCIGYDSTLVEFLTQPRNNITVYPDKNPCEGDSVFLSAEFQYQNLLWSTGETTKSINIKNSGVYTLTFWNDGSNCKGNTQIEVLIRPRPSADIVFTPSVAPCEGEPMELSLSKKFDNLLWSDGSSSSTLIIRKSGRYTCIYWDNGGCSNIATIDIKFKPLPVSEFIINKLVFCDGDTAQIKLKDSFTNILWSTGETTQSISTTISGDYNVNFWDEYGCMGTLNISLKFEPLPVPSIKTTMNNPCDDSPIELKADGPYSSYQWFEVGNNLPIYNSNPILIKKSGQYFVKVINDNGCEGISKIVNLNYDSNPLPKFLFNLDPKNSTVEFDSVGFSIVNCKAIEINNITNKDVLLKNPRLEDNWDFTVPQGQFPLLIPAKKSSNLLICFTPTSFGTIKDILTLSDGCFDYTIPLIGTGISNIYLSTDSLIVAKTESLLNTIINMSFEFSQASNLMTIMIQSNLTSNSKLNYYVYDYLGLPVLQGTEPVSLSSFNGKYRTGEVSFSTETLLTSTYLVIVEYNGYIFSSKLLINK